MAAGRPGDRTFFIYDHSVVQREEDDPKDAIVYFYPHSVSTDAKCLLCGQLMGMVDLMKTLGSSLPRLYRLKKLKIATIHEANFTLALASKQRTPDDAVRGKLDHLYAVFAFYHGSLQRVLLECGNKREMFLKNMNAIWDCYLPFIRRYGNTIPAMFEPIPRIQLPKSDNLLFLRCSHLLQWLKSKAQLLGGCILYKNSVLCTQLDPELTSRLLLIKPNQSHLPSRMVAVEYSLPYGVRIMSIYLTDEEYRSLVKQTEILSARITSNETEKELGNQTMQHSDKIKDDKSSCLSNSKGALNAVNDKPKVQSHPTETSSVLNIPTEMKVRMENNAENNIDVTGLKDQNPEEKEKSVSDKIDRNSLCDELRSNEDDGKQDEMRNRCNTEEVTAGIGENILGKGKDFALDRAPHETIIGNESKTGDIDSQNVTITDKNKGQNCKMSNNENGQLHENENFTNSNHDTSLQVLEVSELESKVHTTDLEFHEHQTKVHNKSDNEEVENNDTWFQSTSNLHVSDNLAINKPDTNIGINLTNDAVNFRNSCHSASTTGNGDINPLVNNAENVNEEDTVPSCMTNSITREQSELHSDETTPQVDQSGTTENVVVEMTKMTNQSQEGPVGSSDGDKEQYQGLFSLNVVTERGDGGTGHTYAEKTQDDDKEIESTPETSTSDNIINKVEGMVNVSLYVQANSDMVLLYLAENSFVQDQKSLYQLWRSVLTELGELEPKLKQCVLHHAMLEDSIYNFIQYDSFDRLLQSSLDNPVTPVQSEFCRAADMLHHKFSKDDGVTDVIVRNHRTAVYAHQNASHQTFVQNRRSPPTSTGIPTRDDMAFALDASAQKLLYRDHGINLL